MKTKNLIIFFSLILIVILGSYIILNKQKNNVNVETTITTKYIDKNNLELCSNKYYETEYNEEGKIRIKNFPYYIIKGKEKCKDNEIMETVELEIQGSLVSYKWCYIRDLSLDHIKDLACVQSLFISSNQRQIDINTIPIDNCIFEQENLNKLSSLVNLEEITFDGCSNSNIDNGWWKNLKKLKRININYNNIPEKDIFDDILPIIEKIPTVEQIGMYRGMGGVSKYLYMNKEKLCGLINNWKNIKTIYLLGDGLEINIKNGVFTLHDDKEQQKYSNCSDLIDGIKKSEDFY